MAKSKDFEIVATPEQADLTLEILARGWMENGQTETTTSASWIPGRVESTSRPGTDPTTVVALRAGSYEKVISVNRPLLWRPQAGAVVGQVSKWVKENRAQLLARRAP